VTERWLDDNVTLFEACDDVLERIRRASFFVLSSDFEGMPNALMEALAMGLPCISTDCPCGGPRFLIRQRENGILVPVGDAEALSAAMIELAENRELRDAIGREAKTIRESLSAESICRMWLEFCEETVHA
jgi:glycosyltransferase involved in cell wall biosynthesis